MLFHAGPLPEGDPALDLAIAHALLRRASKGEIAEAVRIYRPREPVAVFGRLDTHLSGFAIASRAAAAAGFNPLVRVTGGRAVAYTKDAVVMDHIKFDPAAMHTQELRFRAFGQELAALFLTLGVDARVGAVPGEYCPGAYSVNARGTAKLAGTAQRIVRNAWLFSSLVIVGDDLRLRPLLSEIYDLLGQPFDGASVGSLAAEVSTITAEDVELALIAGHGMSPSDAQPLQPKTLELAHELVAQHRA